LNVQKAARSESRQEFFEEDSKRLDKAQMRQLYTKPACFVAVSPLSSLKRKASGGIKT